VTAVRHGIRRIAVRLGFPLELEVVNEAFQGMLLAMYPVMTREHMLLDSRRGQVQPHTEQEIGDGLPGLLQERLEFLFLGNC
jgi:hypothetical protein